MEAALIAKIGAGVAGVAGVGVGGCYAAGLIGGGSASEDQGKVRKITKTPTDVESKRDTFISWGLDKPSPWTASAAANSWNTESQEDNGLPEGFIGKIYGRYIVGVFGKQDKTEQQKQQWNDIYDQRISNIKETGMRGAHSPFIKGLGNEIAIGYMYKEVWNQNREIEALNVGCKSIYKKSIGEIGAVEPTAENTKERVQRDLFKYCSPVGTVPSLIMDGGDLRDKDLVKTQDPKNDDFWTLQNMWFQSIKDTVTDDFFGPYARGTASPSSTVRDACDAAYAAMEASENAVNIGLLVKYCALGDAAQ